MPEYYVDAKIVTTFRKKIRAANEEAAKAAREVGLIFEEEELVTSEYLSSEIINANGDKVA